MTQHFLSTRFRNLLTRPGFTAMAAVSALWLAMAPVVMGATLLDQQNLLDGVLGGQGIGRYNPSTGVPDPAGTTFDLQDAQTFRAGVTGLLAQIRVPVRNLNGGTLPVTLELRNVDAGAPDSFDVNVIGSVSLPASAFNGVDITNAATWATFDVSGLGLNVVAGELYAFSLKTADTAPFNFVVENSLGYPDGEGFRRNRAQGEGWFQSGDFGFQTFVQVPFDGDLTSVLPHARVPYKGTFGAPGFSTNDFTQPSDIKINPVTAQRVIVDKGNHRVLVYNSSDGFTYGLGIGAPGAGPGEFNLPHAVTFNNVGDMYITDSGNHRVQIFDNSGTFLGQFGGPGTGNGQFNTPTGIVYNAPFGEVILVVDSQNHRVQQFGLGGGYLGQFGSPGSGPSQFNNPVGICLDASSQLYIADQGNHRIQHLEPTGFYLGEWGTFGTGTGEFNSPAAVQYNGSNRVYVADTLNDRIQIFTEAGSFITEINPVGSGQLDGMQGMQFVSSFELLLANTNNHTVDRFQVVDTAIRSAMVHRNGIYHLTTYENSTADLLYGSYRGLGTWALEYVESSADFIGAWSSIAIDTNDNPHIAYYRSSDEFETLRYATRSQPNGPWTLETAMGAGGDGAYNSIALNSADEPRIASLNFNTGTLEFVERLSSVWVTDSGLSLPADVTAISLAMNGQDQPVIVYSDDVGISPDELLIVQRNGTWSSPVVLDTGPVIGNVDLEMRAGAPVLAYQYGDNELKFAEEIMGVWQTVTADGPGSEAGYFANMEIDPIDGEPRILHATAFANELRLTYRSNGAWNSNAIVSISPIDLYPVLALDDFGNPTIVYNETAEFHVTTSPAFLNISHVSPNTVNPGLETIRVVGLSVAIGPPSLVQLQHNMGLVTLAPLTTGTSGPGMLDLNMDFTGAPIGAYHLILNNAAGGDTLLNAVVVHNDDSSLNLTRLTTAVGDDRWARYTKPGTSPVQIAVWTHRDGNVQIITRDPVLPDVFINNTTVPTAESPGGPDWSPDGSRIAYVSGVSFQLYTVDLATGNSSQELTFGDVFFPAWSPVDERIVYNTTGVAGTPIYTIESGSDFITQLTSELGPEYYQSPEFSPDGQRVATTFASTAVPGAGRSLVSMSSFTGEAGGITTLLDDGNNNDDPAWSPDGQWIAYTSDSAGNQDIYIISSNGAIGPFQVTSDPGADRRPAWSPDGQNLLFDSNRVGNSATDIFEADVSGFFQDTDGDLVPDAADACPLEAPGLGEIDRDFDGCADATGSFRQVRFWAEDLLPVFYQTDALGDSTIIDGSDFTEMEIAFGDWSSGALAGVVFGGGDDLTRSGPSDATSGDGINNVSFRDPDGFDFGTIAVTYSSVATGDTTINGRWYRPGEIVDADVLFNTLHYNFGTPSSPGPIGAFDLGTVALHEFGHFAGFRHSTSTNSTMFSVVFRGLQQRTLEDDDVTLGLRGYSDLDGLPLPLGVEGKVLRGEDGVTPVVGAAVMAIDEATGDTAQVTYSGMDGVYRFYPPLPTDIRIWIHPLDGTPGVNGTQPSFIGQEFALVAETDFLPEFYDGGTESNNDFGAPGVVVNPGFVFGADILTNPDLQPPVVVSTSPANGELAAPANGAVTIKFDEKIDLSSVNASSLQLFETLPPNTGVGGAVSLLSFDSLLVFTPNVPLDWSTQYTLLVNDIADKFGNARTDTNLVNFTVQIQPPLAITGVSPAEAPEGGTLVISGTGFNNGDATQNTVTFLGAGTVPSFAATLEEVFVTVPVGAQSGSLQVNVGSVPSNWFPITIVQPKGIPVGTPLGAASLGANPKRVEIGPQGAFAYVSTDAGVTAVNANPSDTNFLTETVNIPLGGGSRGVVVMPDGRRAMAISSSPPELNVIDVEPGSGFQNQIDATARVPLAAEPLGIAVVPGGAHVIIAYADRVVRHVASTGVDFGVEVQQWNETDVQYLGYLAVSAGASEVYATRTDGKISVLSFDPAEGVSGVVATLSSGTDARDVAGTPNGLRMLSVDQGATIREFDVRGPMLDSHSESGGYNGLTVSPEGSYAYAANLILNKVDVFALTSSVSLATSISTGVDPQDVATGFSGRYVYVVTDGPDQLEVFDTELGPVIELVNPISGGDGSRIALIGTGFDPSLSTVMIGGVPGIVDTVSSDSTSMVVTQPVGANDTGISVMSGTQASNTRPYNVVNRPDEGNLIIGARPLAGTVETMNRVMMSPTEEYLFTTYQNGTVIVMGGDPSGPDFMLPVQTILPTTTSLPGVSTPDTHRLAMTPNGRKLYTEGAGSRLNVWDVAASGTANPVTFLGEVTDDVAPATIDVDNLVMSPDGKTLFALDVTTSLVYEIDTGSDAVNNVFSVNTAAPGAMAIHPDGSRLFLGHLTTILATFAQVRIMDVDPDSPTYGTEVGSVDMPVGTPSGAPSQLVPSRDGSTLYVLTSEVQAVSEGWDVQFLIIDPSDPNYLTVPISTGVSLDARPTMVPNRSGTMLFWVTPNTSEIQAMLTNGENVGTTGFQVRLGATFSIDISADDARIYAPGFGDELQVYDVSAASSLNIVSGTGQVGVVNQPLAAPIVVQVTDTDPALAEGAVIQFQATPQSGVFSTGNKTLLTAADANGFAQATYIAGGATQQDTVNVSAVPGGLATFFTVVGDTASQPPQIVSVTPLATSVPGVNTKVAVDFSKAINPATLGGNFLLRNLANGVFQTGTFATANGGKRAVLTPSVPLDYGTPYDFQVNAGIQDYSGNALTNPQVYLFTTAVAPVGVTLNSLSPTSGVPGNTMVLAGNGFSPTLSENTVYFNGSPVAPSSGDPGALTAQIPSAASTGDLYVVVDDGTPDTSNVKTFRVLYPAAPVTEEIALVSVPSSGQQIAALPNGTYAYMTSSGANTVVPINVPGEVSEAAISVGLSPFAVVAAPASDRVYCSNFLSNTISVIDADTASAHFNSVVHTIATGNGPTGLAIHPDGRTLYVLNYSDSTLDFVDTDALSATFGLARKSINTNSTSKSMTVTPDGALVVVGTSVGLLVLDTSDGAARKSINTNSTSKSMTVTPDGAAVVVLTEDNQLLLINLFAADGEDPELARTSINTNSTSKSMTVSPDGGFVYVTTEDNNVLVFAIVTIGGGGAADGATFLGFQLVATIEVGENPFGMAVVLESGVLLVVNEGDGTVTFINISDITVGELVVEVEASPNTLNLGSKGRFITGAIEFPAYLDPLDLDLESVLLNGEIPADTSQGIVLTDKDLDDIPEAEVKFSRQAVIDILPEGQMVEIVISGLHLGRAFAGEDSIRIKRPKIKNPGPGQAVPPNAETEITWEMIQDGPADHVDILVSTDLGETWEVVIEGTDDDEAHTWMVPDVESEQALLMIAARDKKGNLLGYDMMNEPFTIGAVVTAAEEVLPARFALLPASPNPFRANAHIRFDLPEPAEVTLRLFAIDGSVVRTFASGEEYPAGRHAFAWDGKNDSGQSTGAGVYFMKIQAGDHQEAVQKIVRLSR